jgi:hypothetical protein
LEYLQESIYYYAYTFYTALLERNLFSDYCASWLKVLGDLAQYCIVIAAMVPDSRPNLLDWCWCMHVVGWQASACKGLSVFFCSFYILLILHIQRHSTGVVLGPLMHCTGTFWFSAWNALYENPTGRLFSHPGGSSWTSQPSQPIH